MAPNDPFAGLGGDVDEIALANSIGAFLSHIGSGEQSATTVGPLSENDSFTDISPTIEPPPPVEPVTDPGMTPVTGAGDPGATANPIPSGAPISGKYGEDRGSHEHAGVDLSVPVGTTVVSAISGTVISAGNNDPGGYGNMIEVQGANGTVTRYAHLSHIGTKVGDKVKAGQPIGKSGGAKGSSGAGSSTGPHLHFEVRQGDHSVDPMPYLAAGASILPADAADLSADPSTAPLSTPEPQDAVDTAVGRVQGALVGQDPGSENQGQPIVTPTKNGTTTGVSVDSSEAGTDPDVWIRKAMAATGVDESWYAPIKAKMMQESGGRNIPQAIHDINTEKGTPAFGPMQVIEPTFRAHMLKGHEDWHNPIDNVIAAIRYIQSRYGHPSNLPRGGY